LVTRSAGSTVVRRRLGTALRELREQANVRIEAAARALECSTAKISRLENGQGPAKALEVRALLDLYGELDPARRARFEGWAARSKSTGWWEPDADVIDDDVDRYVAFETEAKRVRSYCTPVVPVILQSGDYAVAHARATNPELSGPDIDRLVHLRQERQAALLDRELDFNLDVILDECALRRAVGSPAILQQQMAWLADLIGEFNRDGRVDLSVRVLPFSAGLHRSAVSAFSIFTPREAAFDPLVANVEDTMGSSWYESSEDVARLVDLFEGLSSLSLTSRESRDLLLEAA
jgi:transcriptional regulator with XRE-family HTH domain